MNKKYNIEKDEWLVGIAIFLISERGLAYLDVLRSLLDRYGFNILCERSIHEDQRHTLVKWVDSIEQLSAGGPVKGTLPT